jgi:hypothetical protein
MEGGGQLHALATLTMRKELPLPMDRKLCGPQNRSGRCEEEEKILPFRESNSGYPARKLVKHYQRN